MIFELLPLLRGYTEDIYQVQNKSLPAGDRETWRADYPGWVTQIEAYVNHRGFVVTNTLVKRPITFTYFELMREGLTGVNPEIWLTVYDDPTFRYMLMYAPRPYYRAVRREDYFQLQAPTIDPATGLGVAVASTINLFRVRYIYLVDEPEFIKSLREVIGASDLADKIDELNLNFSSLNENIVNITIALGGTPTKPPPEAPPTRRAEGPPPPREEPEVFDPAELERRRRVRMRGGY